MPPPRCVSAALPATEPLGDDGSRNALMVFKSVSDSGVVTAPTWASSVLAAPTPKDHPAYIPRRSVITCHFPCIYPACRENGMYLVTQGRLVPRSEHRSPCGYYLERLNKPVERPLRR